MPSGPVYGARYGDAYILSPPVAGPGGGTGPGGKGLTEKK